MAYLIVIFTDEEETALIPDNWLDGTSCALWPPYKTSARINSAVLKKEPPGDTWRSLPIRIIYRSDSYDKTRSKLKQSELDSDLQTDTNDIPSKRQRRRAPIWTSDESSEDEAPATLLKKSNTRTNNQAPVSGRSTCLPSPPARLHILSQDSEPSPGVRFTEPATSATKETTSILSRLSHARDIRIFTMLEKISAEQQEQRILLQQLLSRGNPVFSKDVATLPDGICFPFKTKEDMETLEDVLSDTESFSSVVKYLSMFGGDSIKDTISRILKEVMTSALARQYNLLGQKGKLKFGALRLASVIYRCLYRNPSTKTATKKDLEAALAKWLAGARDRDGGRKNRVSLVPDATEGETALL